MRFAVGYQLHEDEGEEPFIDIVRDYQAHIAEVYFPWGDMPSGRSPLTTRRGYTDWGAQARMEADLRALRAMGIGLDVLFNANCYGHKAISRQLESQIISVLDHLGESVGGADTVTTTSLAVARTVKRHYPRIEVRASVNMRIGTILGMEYVSELFDGYYIQRELNRNIRELAETKAWADANDKKLYLLANSGCLNYCPGQTFHDNLVAHEQEISEMRNIEGWVPHVCWQYLRDRSHWVAAMRNSWIRPEDLHHYEQLFPVVKLATRMHAQPRLVLEAYTARRHYGNLLDLLEPSFSSAFAPCFVDNRRFPEDWFTRTSTCDQRCADCTYCADVLDRVLAQAPCD